MAGKTLINGTNYNVSNGKTLINGTAYTINNGKTLIGGTSYNIQFKKTIQFSYTGNWRWYQNNSQTGIVEIYGNGVLNLLSDDVYDLCLIGGGEAGNRASYTASGGSGAFMTNQFAQPLSAGSYAITIGAGGAATTGAGQIGGETKIVGDNFTLNALGGGGVSRSGVSNGGNGGSGGGAAGTRSSSATTLRGGAGGSNGSNGGNGASGTGGTGDGKTKYLFGNTSFDLYCGGGGGSDNYTAATSTGGGAGGAGGGGQGGGYTTTDGYIAGKSGTKYGAGGGGSYSNRGAGNGYQGALFIRLAV